MLAKKSFVKVMFLTLFSFVCTVSLYAVDQDISDMYPSATPSEVAGYLEQKVLEEEDDILKNFTFSGFVDLQQGYDNNVDLDPQRNKDGFFQDYFNAELNYKFSEEVYARAGVDTFNIIYYKYNINNLLDVSPYLGVDWAITPDVIWKNRIIFDYFSYPNQKESSFNGLVLTSYVRHYVLRDFYHEVGLEYLKRWFPDRKISLNTGARARDDRVDDRYRVKYNMGLYGEKYYLRVSNEFANNESNDGYQDYYDYWLYRVRPAVMYFFTDKLYTDISLIYRYTRYKDRRSTEDESKKVRDHTYIGTVSVYYDLNSKITLGVTYSYTENTSNDPFQKYSGSTITGGVFYSF